jgi:cytochrome oxidase Cu insertion factor (SCO1/SenC/PrrC family)
MTGLRSGTPSEIGATKLKINALAALTVFVSLLAIGCRAEKSSLSNPPAPAIGIGVGQNMPTFAARDQFGREVSSDRLKGPNGLVLLFFRSADW